MSKGPPTNPTIAATTMDMRVRAREGIKARQILIDAQTPGEGILRGTSDTGLVEAANVAVRYIIPLLYMQQWCLSFILYE